MIDRAALYLASPDDAAGALLPVAGRPVAFRTLVALLRAGVREVGLPCIFRDGPLSRAVATSPAIRERVVWLDPSQGPPPGPVLLAPAATLVSPVAVVVVATAAPGTVLDGLEPHAPLLAAPPSLVTSVWGSLARGEPLGAALAGAPGLRAVAGAGGPGSWRVPVRSAGAARAAEAVLHAALGSPADTWLDRQVHRRLSRPVTRAAIRLGVTPNQVSLGALLVGLGGAWCMLQGAWAWGLAGLALYAAAVVLDHADGEVARLGLMESALGAWLDVAVDTAIHAAMVAAMGAASAGLTGRGATAGALAAAGIVACAGLARIGGAGAGGVGALLRGLGNRDAFYAMLVVWLLALALAPAWLPALLATVAAGAHAYWLGCLAVWAGRRKTARNPK